MLFSFRSSFVFVIFKANPHDLIVFQCVWSRVVMLLDLQLT